MMTEKELLEINRLLEQNSSGQITVENKARLLDYMERYWLGHAENTPHPNDEAVFEPFMKKMWQETLDSGNTGIEPTNQIAEDAQVDWSQMYQAITGHSPKTSLKLPTGQTPVSDQTNVISDGRKTRIRWVAAAVFLIALGFGGWWWINTHNTGSRTQLAEKRPSWDLPAPSSARAVLILADGTEIMLDSMKDAVVGNQNKTDVHMNGQNSLTYNAGSAIDLGKLQYNELRVLKGSQPVKVQLSDGSKVWLNVGSSLRYPVVFASNQRNVTLNGEGYFEVTHEADRPFVVRHGDIYIKVLGTHFNINCYADEPNLKVTLLLGAVEVAKKDQHLLLHPGQQAVTASDETGGLTLRKMVDLDQILSWRSSEFVFGQSTDFKAIMRQIARWYNVEVSFTGEITTRFWGTVPRTAGIQEVLSILEATGGVKFDLEGHHLQVIPIR